MKATDFLTILGIGLAVWALIPRKERKFILLFFSKFHFFLLITSILFLHYLFSFYWLADNWFPALHIFITPKGIPSSTWAYIFSIFIVAFPVIKVLYGFFAPSRKEKLIELYKSQIKDNDIDLLVEYINKYHINDIILYLKGLSTLSEKSNVDFLMHRRTQADIEYKKLVKPIRIKFGATVYGRILQNGDFVKKVSVKYPELLAKAFSGMETEKAANESLVKLFIECIFESKNQSFISELKIINKNDVSIEEWNKDYEMPILYGLLAHTKAAAKNYVWYPVGEKTVKSLKHDKAQIEFLRKKYDHDIVSELWNYKAYIGIVYFNYMVRETIYKDSGWHMWLYYYRHFTVLLTELIPEENDYDHEQENPSFAHHLIVEMIWNMRDWLELSKEENKDYQIIDTIKCLGNCIVILCFAPTIKISKSFKIRQLDLIISLWFKYTEYPENDATKLAKEWLIKMFLNPKNVDWGQPDLSNESYKSILSETWEKFDKIPYNDGFEEGSSIKQFKEEVLTPLQIN